MASPRIVAARHEGIFDEKNVFEMFAWLRPEENVMTFFRSNYLLGEDPPSHPLLFWSMDYTRLPAGLYADILDLSYANKLAKGELTNPEPHANDQRARRQQTSAVLDGGCAAVERRRLAGAREGNERRLARPLVLVARCAFR